MSQPALLEVYQLLGHLQMSGDIQKALLQLRVLMSRPKHRTFKSCACGDRHRQSIANAYDYYKVLTSPQNQSRAGTNLASEPEAHEYSE